METSPLSPGNNEPLHYIQRWGDARGYTHTGEIYTLRLATGFCSITNVEAKIIKPCITAAEVNGKRFNGIHSFTLPNEEGVREIKYYVTER